MKIKLLGTAAAEGFPAVFCKCQPCMDAKKKGGKDIRTRTSAVIDEQVKIDFPADTLHHVISQQLDLGSIEHLLFTHTHHDHFYPNDLTMRAPVYAHDIDYPLHIYGHDAVMKRCKEVLPLSKDLYDLHHLQPYLSFQAGELEVTPLLADHDPLETCFIFYIEKKGKSILYGHDTGWFPSQTWEWLKDKKMDAVILDCTHGLQPTKKNHLGIPAVKEIKEIFTKMGNINKDSQVIATHFSHNTKLSHQELKDILNPVGITVAYDGMVTEI